MCVWLGHQHHSTVMFVGHCLAMDICQGHASVYYNDDERGTWMSKHKQIHTHTDIVGIGHTV